MYRLAKSFTGSPATCVQDLDTRAYIPFAPDNTDYQTFKQAINDDTAQLQDADGILMTPDEAKAFVATLP